MCCGNFSTEFSVFYWCGGRAIVGLFGMGEEIRDAGLLLK